MLKALQIHTVIVTFEKEEFARLYQQSLTQPWTMIADTDRQLFEVFQMRKASWFDLFSWNSLSAYLDLVFLKWRRVKMPSNHDYRQLGGDVLIDPSGIVRLHHVSVDPSDRPAIDHIFSRVPAIGKPQV